MQKAVFGNVKGNLLAHKRVPFENIMMMFVLCLIFA